MSTTHQNEDWSILKIFTVAFLLAALIISTAYGTLVYIAFNGERRDGWKYSYDNYNEELEIISLSKKIIGQPISMANIFLGRPTDISTYWQNLDSNGMPNKDSLFITTYNYYPYPLLPFNKFQVHSENGIIKGIEKYDD